ncbi:MAG: hypothetical protein ACSHX6_17175 [Akkermansiaceae bacterium]
MIKRILIALAISTGVYVACYVFGDNNRPLSNYSEPRIQYHLRNIERILTELQHVELNISEETTLNQIIAECYSNKSLDEVSRNAGLEYPHPEYSYIAILHFDISSIKQLDYWNSSLICVRNKELPSGFGFYLTGEDHVSKTSGNDPDDINSWNRESWHFYYDRGHQKETKKIITISTILASITFILLMFPLTGKK